MLSNSFFFKIINYLSQSPKKVASSDVAARGSSPQTTTFFLFTFSFTSLISPSVYTLSHIGRNRSHQL